MNIIIRNDDRSFVIAILDIERVNDYFQFRISIKCSAFNVSTIAYSSIDELHDFKEGLKEMAERKISTILFSPLGALWNLKFRLKEKTKDMVLVQGGISDLERTQSDLKFCGCVNINNLLNVYKE